MDEPFLSNRELATLIILAFFAVILVVTSRTKLLASIRSPLSLLVSPTVLVPLLLYVGWVLAAVLLASRLEPWEPALWKTAVFWLILSGFGLIFDINSVIQEPGFFWHRVARTLGFLVIVEFLVNLQSFALWIEIPAQLLALFALVVVAAEKTKAAAKLAEAYLALFGLSALVWAGWHLVINWSDADQGALLLKFLLPVLLTPWALVFIYVATVLGSYQVLFKRMRLMKIGEPLAGQRLAILLRTCGWIPALRLLSGPAVTRLARTNGFREAWNEVEQIRLDERERIEAEAAAERRLIENAGVAGVDEFGQQLDQREFAATRATLRRLALAQMGHYRNRGKRYQEDLLRRFERYFEEDGLSQPNGIALHVSTDGQSWYAERQTVSGHWFALGAAGPPTDQWLFDDSEKPNGFPVESEWDQWGGGEHSKNWD